MSFKLKSVLIFMIIFGLILGTIVFVVGQSAPATTNQIEIPTISPTSSRTPLPPRANAAGRLVLGADISLIDPIFDANLLLVDVTTGNAEWLPDTMVIGVQANGTAVAYPIGFLSLHEVINDTVGGEPIVVTWCPLCFSAVVYSRTVDEEVRTFRISGYLLESNLVLEDMQTRTLWSQLSGLNVRGGVGRQRLNAVSYQMMTWGEWQATYPQTKIISGKLSANPNDFDYYNDPYNGYYSGGVTGIGRTGNTDDRLPAKSLVVGLEFNQQSIAVPYNAVYEQGVIQLTVSNQPVVIFMNPDTAHLAVFSAIIDDETYEFYWAEDGLLRDKQTDTIWNPLNGMAETGVLAGRTLQPIASRTGFWFAWADHYPDTAVWE